MADQNHNIILFNSTDGDVSLEVLVDAGKEEIWLNRQQMSILFDRDVKTIGKHINNALKEELDGASRSVVAKFATTASDGKSYQVDYYNLDVIISVGYRVKSRRGVEFRRWATDVLHRYIMDGVAENKQRLDQLAQAVQIIERLSGVIEKDQIFDIIKAYTTALDLLDDYDHQRIPRPKGSQPIYVLDYDECREIIASMRFSKRALFLS